MRLKLFSVNFLKDITKIKFYFMAKLKMSVPQFYNLGQGF